MNSAPAPRQSSYSCVLKGVHKTITMEEVEDALMDHQLRPSKLWRITSRKTGEPTTLVRILSRHEEDVLSLIQNGLKLLGERLRAEASHPPPNQPLQCNRCLAFHAITTGCTKSQTCGLCSGPHATNFCTKTAETTPKCANCGGNHAAFSYSAPAAQRPPLRQSLLPL
ncbi:PREDICTED: nucleic-acid-binding protein from mobile element jockey-like [Nicrophorus vespilloides]|uniref:Nucleic-acid-binding protein from mobile element jockey-like n=1 Tax=Nicrophorus vespilloides TaxID=110193 RepID=A0ABM1N5F0_NICVS|nr:PREDICTED: nucleic-acid-binding protein from mobile element jockey-like [Nicrophorus vespilloides]